jgi:hypothetical protein
MEKKIIAPFSEILVELEIDGIPRLGMNIASKRRNRAATQFAEVKNSEGSLFYKTSEGLKNKPWRILGALEKEGNIYLYGDMVRGRTLTQILKQADPNDLVYLHRLAEVLKAAEEKDFSLGRINSEGIIFTENGEVLLLPREIMDLLASQQSSPFLYTAMELFNHPEKKEEEGYVFSLGVLAYLCITGGYPFTADDEIELHKKMRDLAILSPRQKIPELKEEISTFIMNSLGQEKSALPGLEDWIDALRSWTEMDSLYREISKVEREEIVEKAKKIEKRRESLYSTKYFFEKHKKAIIIAGIVTVLVVGMVVNILRGVMAPPVTEGMGPRAVVELFYSSINSFDHAAIEDAVVKGVAKEEIRQATNLYVISRMRLAYEQKTGFIPADQWIAEGEPELARDETLYGIANLSITPIGETIFKAEYDRWLPGSRELEEAAENPKDETSLSVEKHHFVDTLYLAHDGRYWVINRIEREQVE